MSVSRFLFVFMLCAFASGHTWKIYCYRHKHGNSFYLAVVTLESLTERIYYLFGSSSPPSPLGAIILRGGIDSKVTVNESGFFGKNISDSIVSHGITESHGFSIFNLCEYDDRKDTATFENYKDAECKNSGEKLNWSLSEDDFVYTQYQVILTFISSHWDPPKPGEHHGVKFTFTISTEDISGAFSVPAARGFAVKMAFSEKFQKPRARLGLGVLIFTNESLHPDQKFLQEDWLDLGFEAEPGNFLVTAVSLNKRDVPLPGDEADVPPAYLFWRDVCFVERENLWKAGRRVSAFQSTVYRHHKDTEHINRSLPQAVFGFKRFNIHVQGNNNVAVMEEWFGFGSPGDGFYAKTNYTEWTFVMALGSPEFVRTSIIPRLFAPLILPLLVFLGSVAYFCYQQHAAVAVTSSDVTRPLISEIGSDANCNSRYDDGYPGFGVSGSVQADNDEEQESINRPVTSYGSL